LIVAQIWHVSPETIRNIVRRHRDERRRFLKALAILEAVAVLAEDEAQSVALSDVIEELDTRETLRRKKFPKDKDRRNIWWRWATTWQLPTTVSELRPCLEAAGLRVESRKGCLVIPGNVFTPNVKVFLRELRKRGLADYKAT
jgi:hypothetical protein